MDGFEMFITSSCTNLHNNQLMKTTCTVHAQKGVASADSNKNKPASDCYIVFFSFSAKYLRI